MVGTRRIGLEELSLDPCGFPKGGQASSAWPSVQRTLPIRSQSVVRPDAASTRVSGSAGRSPAHRGARQVGLLERRREVSEVMESRRELPGMSASGVVKPRSRVGKPA